MRAVGRGLVPQGHFGSRALISHPVNGCRLWLRLRTRQRILWAGTAVAMIADADLYSGPFLG